MMSSIYSKSWRVIVCAALITTACKTYIPVTEQSALVKISALEKDSAVVAYYRPFKDSLDKMMKVPLAELSADLTKQLPESTLGNHLSDILRKKARDYTQQPIDVAILNYGGIRVPSLAKGTLRVEHAYWVMPFDNYVVVQQLTGQQLRDFCDSMAMKKGWPVAGLQFIIAPNNTAVQIKVGGKPLDTSATYNVALNDYVANGGDGMTFLKNIPQRETGKLFRDAIIEYWQEQAAAHQPVQAILENRISYAQ